MPLQGPAREPRALFLQAWPTSDLSLINAQWSALDAKRGDACNHAAMKPQRRPLPCDRFPMWRANALAVERVRERSCEAPVVLVKVHQAAAHIDLHSRTTPRSPSNRNVCWRRWRWQRRRWQRRRAQLRFCCKLHWRHLAHLVCHQRVGDKLVATLGAAHVNGLVVLLKQSK